MKYGKMKFARVSVGVDVAAAAVPTNSSAKTRLAMPQASWERVK